MTQPAEAARPAPRQRLAYLDLINTVAIWFVVFLHVRIVFFDPRPTPGWWLENILSGIGVAAVPLFFMNSGATLVEFSERESIGTFFRKRLNRVLVPYLIWGQLYLLFRWSMGWVADMGPQRIAITLVAGSSVAGTLWYLEAALGIYLVLPVVSLAVAGAKRLGWSRQRVCGYLIAVALAASVAVPLIRQFLPAFLPNFTIPFGAGYLGYVLLGYALANFEFSRLHRWLLACLGVVGLALFILVGGFLGLAGSPHARLFTDYLSPGTVMFASAAFSAVRHLNWQRWPAWFTGTLKWLAGLTFGIYLVHLMLIQLVTSRWPIANSWQVIPAAIVAWGVSLLLVWLLRLIPPIRNWLLP